MRKLRPVKGFAAVVLAAAATGALLVTAPAAHADDSAYKICKDAYGTRLSPGGYTVPAGDYAVGATGDCVRGLQELVSRYGLTAWEQSGGPFVDGQFGARTDSAIRRFQSNRGLVSDGIVGPRTWEKLLTG
ncbi:peptidoglycan-binding domain-containing protein [Streptomyces sp. NPDC094049]|uniref:peptidoglycan-binding domain-containing protein n=1 Tax=Streptomyces sp. NPDC094049 TaxID=3154987 RepID=UPI003332501B